MSHLPETRGALGRFFFPVLFQSVPDDRPGGLAGWTVPRGGERRPLPAGRGWGGRPIRMKPSPSFTSLDLSYRRPESNL